ncbi:3',5'-cyclic-nucleotide phosphodiesterase [Aureococcus anophagefferens]|nr:3',5'-cyclic-nucleotide phosphodiesterase [Aureococcus anophagefferens]
MALPFIKGIARRLSTGGKGETAVVPAQESPEGPSPAAFPGERGKRPSRVGLRAFFGGGDSSRDAGEDSVGQLVRQIRAQSDKMSKKELDAKLLEVIHRVDALSPSRVDEVEGWETRLAGTDQGRTRRVSGASERSLEDFGADLGAEDGDTRERPRLPRSNSEPRKSFNELQRTVSLWDAAALGDVDLCKDALALLDVDAADYDSRTALHYAAAEGHYDCVLYLVDVAGASTDCLDRYGNTPLSVALRQKRQSCVDALLERGAKLPDTVATPASASANKQVIEAAAENDVDALRDLPSVGDYDKRTPLHLAASNGCLDAARFLVDDCQAELNAADRWGNGPLDDALRHEHGAVVKYLEARGARRLHALRASDAGARGDEWQPPRRVAVGDSARRNSKASNGQAMLLLGEALIGSFDAVDKPTLNLFLLRISSDYGDNPYHSRAHGADALLTTHLLLTKQDLAKRCSPDELLAAYVGAAVHDYSHPGSSNAHEVKVASPLALRYSDDTVLERHHLAAAFMVLAEPRFDVLGGLGKDAKPAARALIIELILMTDLKRHSDFIARKLKPLGPRGHKAMQGADEPWVSPLKGDGVDARLVLTVAIKFADIGHVLKPFAVHKAWTERATEEFWRLGDKEKSLGVAVSPLCDRAKDVDVARSQIGFFKFVCLPFYKVPGHAAKLASALASPEAPLRRSVQDAESRSSAPLEPLEPKRSFMRRKSSADSVEDRAALSLRSGGSSPSGRDAPRSLVGQALDAVRGPRKSGTSISATPRTRAYWTWW